MTRACAILRTEHTSTDEKREVAGEILRTSVVKYHVTCWKCDQSSSYLHIRGVGVCL